VSVIPKHEATKRKAKSVKTAPDPDESRYGPEALAKNAAFEANDYRTSDPRHSSCVEESLDGLTSVISTWVTQERDGDNGASLYSTPSAYPVKVRLITDDNMDMFDGIVGALGEQGDKQAAALERIATAFERIADAMTKAQEVHRG
jgi:hypothetical protein